MQDFHSVKSIFETSFDFRFETSFDFNSHALNAAGAPIWSAPLYLIV